MQHLRKQFDAARQDTSPNVRPSAEVVAAKLRAIDHQYAWDGRRKGKRRPYNRIANIRMRELERWFAYAYGDQLPDDDAGRDDLLIAASHVVQIAVSPDRAIRSWVRTWAPWCKAADLAELIEMALAERWLTADELAWRLGLTDANRSRLGLKTIGSIDVNKAARIKRRMEQDRLRKEAKRRAAGVKPRKKPKRPWELMKMSRRTWYRRGKPTPPSRSQSGTSGTPKSAIDKDEDCGLSVPIHTPSGRMASASAPPRSATGLKMTG